MWASTDGFSFVCASYVLCCSTSRIHWHQQMSPYILTRGMVSAVASECCGDCLVEHLQEWDDSVRQILRYSNGWDDPWKPWRYIKEKEGLHMLDPWPWDTVFKPSQSVRAFSLTTVLLTDEHFCVLAFSHTHTRPFHPSKEWVMLIYTLSFCT